MKVRICFTVLCLVVGSASAFASPIVTLTFDGLKSGEPISNYYNGGSGGLGSTGGTNYGVSFTSDSLAIISQNVGGSGNFDNVPPPATNTIAFFLSGAGDTMDVANGFATGFSFYYSSPYFAGNVQVYSGLDGTGTLLATDNLTQTASFCNGSIHDYSCWINSGVSFGGAAKSVVFTGTANYIGFADVTLGASQVPPVPTPESSSFLLLGTGVFGVLGAMRRKHLRGQARPL